MERLQGPAEKGPFAHGSPHCAAAEAQKHGERLICGLFGKSAGFHSLCGWLVCLSFQVCVSICVFVLEVDEVQ